MKEETLSNMENNNNRGRKNYCLKLPETIEECLHFIKEQNDRLQEQEKVIEELNSSKNRIEKHLQQLITFYQYAPSGYLILDRDGVILDLDKPAAIFMEQEANTLKGKKFQNFLDEPSVFVLNYFLFDLFKSKEKISRTILLKSQQETLINVLIEGRVLESGNECMVDIVDISRRISMFDQFAECEMRCRSLLDDLNEGIVILDLDGTFKYVNSAGGSIFGASCVELRNKKLDECLNPEQLLVIQREAQKLKTGKRSKYELEIVTFDGISKSLLASSAPYYNREGKLAGTLNMFSDITRQKKDANEIRRRLKLELIISEISNDFVHLKKKYLDHSVNRALEKIGSFAGVDRSYIFLFTDDGLYCNNTHEWCKPGVKPQKENLQDVSVNLIPWWMDKLKKFETIHIPLVTSLPPEAQHEKELLEMQSIQSLLVIPLLTSDELIGFLGFDSVSEVKKWENEDVLLLTMLGEILGNGFGRIKYEENLIRINTYLEQKVEERTRDITKLLELNRAIVNNVELMVISTDQDGIIRSFNPFAEKMLGYKYGEIVGRVTPLIFHDNMEIQDKTGKKLTPKDKCGYKQFNLLSRLGFSENKYTEGNEWVYVAKDGRKINVLLTVSKLEDEKGETSGFVVVAIDITDRKQNELYAVIQRDLGFSLATTTTIEQALSQVIQATLKIEGIHGVGIYLLNNLANELELVLHEGFSDGFIRKVRKYRNDHIQFKIVQRGESVYGSYNAIITSESDLFANEQLNQIGIIPIKHEEKIIGSLNVASRASKHFKYAAKMSLEIISSQIGGTLARINTENALKLSQRNFHLVFETIDDFMFILDSEGKIIKTNPVVERRLGYTQKELSGMSVPEVHPPERREEAAAIVSDMLAGKIEFCPVPLYKKNGEIIPVETKVVFGKWDGKDALYGISRDISERIKAEETLRESERRWNFALEGSGDGVWDWNILTNNVFYSKQWKAMLGYSSSEMENNVDGWKNRVHPDDLSQALSDLDTHFNGESEVYINEHRLRCKDGTYKWILTRGKMVEWTASGKPARIIGTHTDITPRKLLEEQLRKAIEKEKELNELKSRFVSTASHEFRTPLASILMVSETLIAYQHKMDAPQIATRLTKIKDHVLHLTNIVSDVLQLSRIQEGKIGFNPHEEDIVPLCRNLIEGFNSTILVRGKIEFRTHLKKLVVLVDHRIITQAVNNLLSNAIKYTGNEPEISLELILENKEWLIQVTDNGIGIPESDQKHLFKPFFRASNVSTIQGSGLGLSIVYESVKMHGGNVSFTSELSKGSAFMLHFPVELLIEQMF
jgi:PAS domain S-box-containing protein